MAQRKRKAAPPRPRRRAVPVYIWVLLLALGGAIALRIALRGDSHHPDPRVYVTGDFVPDGQRYAAAPQIAEIYTMAKAIPNVLDGLHCYCECARDHGHRSLLTCFESDHGAACDICLQEAALAYRLTQEGAGLDQIRERIDAMFAIG